MPDFRIDSTQADAVGDRIVDRWIVKGTWAQPFPGGPLAGAKPSGRAFTLPGVSIAEVEGGKRRSYTQYWDQLAFLSQIGVIEAK